MRDQYGKYEGKTPAARDYDVEARNLIKGMDSGKLYELLGIVRDQLQRGCSETRQLELEAVRKAIFAVPRLDSARLTAMMRGYRSEMAADAKAVDGNSPRNRKKV